MRDKTWWCTKSKDDTPRHEKCGAVVYERKKEGKATNFNEVLRKMNFKSAPCQCDCH